MCVMRQLISLLLVLLLPAVAVAGDKDKIYRTTDDDGNVVYTNEPPSEDAEPVELDPLTTVPPGEEIPDDTSSNDASEAAADEGTSPRYEGLKVTYPPHDQTVRHNGGLVPFRVEVRPEGTQLAEGHKVEVLLDGEVRGSARDRQISVSAVNRGPHTVEARIVDSTGAVITQSQPTEFYLLRAAVGDQAQ